MKQAIVTHSIHDQQPLQLLEDCNAGSRAETALTNGEEHARA